LQRLDAVAVIRWIVNEMLVATNGNHTIVRLLLHGWIIGWIIDCFLDYLIGCIRILRHCELFTVLTLNYSLKYSLYCWHYQHSLVVTNQTRYHYCVIAVTTSNIAVSSLSLLCHHRPKPESDPSGLSRDPWNLSRSIRSLKRVIHNTTDSLPYLLANVISIYLSFARK